MNGSSMGMLEKGWSSIRKTFEEFWKRKIFVLLMFIMICFALSCYSYSKSMLASSTIVSLDYEEASK